MLLYMGWIWKNYDHHRGAVLVDIVEGRSMVRFWLFLMAFPIRLTAWSVLDFGNKISVSRLILSILVFFSFAADEFVEVHL